MEIDMVATPTRARATRAAPVAPAAGAAAAPAVQTVPATVASAFKTVAIPLPARSGGGGGGFKYPFETMELGSAFFVPYGESTPKQTMNRMTGAITRAKKTFEANFSARHFVDTDNVFGFGPGTKGVGIWRVEVKPEAPAAPTA